MDIVAVILILLAAFLTIGVGVNVGSLHSSDAAGNGLAQGFAMVLAIGDWIVLAILLLVCGARGGFPRFSGVVMLFAFALAVAGQGIAMRLLMGSGTEGAAATLLSIVTVAAPVLLILRTAWGIFPPLRASVPELAGSWAPIVLLILVSLVPIWFRSGKHPQPVAVIVPFTETQKAQDQQHLLETLAAIEALPVNSNLFAAIVHCADPEPSIRSAARAKARTFVNRQAEAEQFLASGHDATLREIPNFDLAPTPALCQSAKKSLDAKARIKPFDNDPIRIEDAEREVAPYIDTMRWLLTHRCDCKTEIAGLEQAVGRFASSPRREKLLADLAAARRQVQ